jgi:uncharacterized glyoxalase superfamily protein PhnB
MEFYQSILGGDLRIGTAADFGVPGPADTMRAAKVMHSTLTTPDGLTLMAWDAPERLPQRPGNNVAVFLSSTDQAVARYFAPLSEGGTVTLPLARQVWGDVAGSLVDRYGVSWMFDIGAKGPADASSSLNRQAVNPVSWSRELGFNQGEVVSGETRTLYISGQTATNGDGRPLHDGDIAAQLALAVANLEAVLAEAGMSMANLARLNVYTTDVDALLPHYGVLASKLGAAGVAPTTTLLGVGRLAIAGQLVELEGTAVA